MSKKIFCQKHFVKQNFLCQTLREDIFVPAKDIRHTERGNRTKKRLMELGKFQYLQVETSDQSESV